MSAHFLIGPLHFYLTIYHFTFVAFPNILFCVIFPEEKVFQPMVILSASMDKTMITWELHEESGVWMDTVVSYKKSVN